ncbi:hypothetical protein [Endozoicomonas sp. GU-1]|nr:hypothetical protein [Endozoicomonas sp. GU-1]WBA82238.1 hypothetical protein O2T12_03505 [Endozoicomonas sp. GU-1]WBA85176.1 hypothetical protein O3276_18200 [Endozoicomonas sp. GU-1]
MDVDAIWQSAWQSAVDAWESAISADMGETKPDIVGRAFPTILIPINFFI